MLIMLEMLIYAVAGMVAQLAAGNINISPRHNHPMRARSGGSVLIGRNTACRLDRYKILCMPSKCTLSRFGLRPLGPDRTATR